MNQIICTLNSNIKNFGRKKPSNKDTKKKRFLKIQFFILFIISLLLIIYYMFFRYELLSKEKLSKSIAQSFGIRKIYEDSSDYNAIPLGNTIEFYENGSNSVIGIIDIKKLNISYPIFSDISKDGLKIATCRFFGPMPNEIRKSLYCRA